MTERGSAEQPSSVLGSVRPPAQDVGACPAAIRGVPRKQSPGDPSVLKQPLGALSQGALGVHHCSDVGQALECSASELQRGGGSCMYVFNVSEKKKIGFTWNFFSRGRFHLGRASYRVAV